MKVLVIGSGAREHAIVWKLQQSMKDLEVYCTPGNAGIAEVTECLNVEETDIERLLELAIVRQIDLTIVGSPKPLSLGIVDRFCKEGLRIFGPTRDAAEIEWSRFYAREFALRHMIPSPKYASFDSKSMAMVYVQAMEPPLVIKDDNGVDGLVTVAYTKEEAEAAIDKCFIQERFGNSCRVIVEQFLKGQQASVYVICDGNFGLSLLPAQDHSFANDGDTGPSTEGMGAYAPAPIVSSEVMQKIRYKVIDPTLNGLRMEGRPYTGILSFDLIIDKDGEPKLIEYNSCFGDPETQVILPLFDEDLYDVCLASAREDLSPFQEGFHKFLGSALCVTLAVDGYPSKVEKGKVIDFSALNARDDSLSGSPGELEQVLKAKSLIFHNATKKIGDDFLSDGGRVISATAVAENLVDAQVLAYKLAEKIDFDGKYYRRDIGDAGMVN